jgi:4-diphosphocytidyl-2-C-methyl-D-erythritol kinase
MPVTLRSFAKINLGLAIGPVRPDGFHALTTVYQTIALHDVLTVSAARAATTRIELTSNDARVPLDRRNTVWKMVERTLAALGVTAEVIIHIDKRLPVQGGLGAGSANAATALVGLERELGLALPDEVRLRVAAEVGSDVPLFLVGGAVLGLERGEQVSPLADVPAIPSVVAVPEGGVSTPAAFREWDARHSALTPAAATDRLTRLSRTVSTVWSQPRSSGVSRGIASEAVISETNAPTKGDLAETPLLALVRTGIANDFEEVVFAQHPSLADIRRVLAGSHPEDAALYAALSGSGSALFGLYASAEAADRAAERLRERGIVALRTETLPREQYWQRMWLDK